MKEIKRSAINGTIFCFRMPDDNLEKVFNLNYLKYRLKIFKAITLKAFQEQTDKNFNLILHQSIHLPQEYKEALAVLEQENSFLYNIYIDDQGRGENTEGFVEYVDDVAINFVIDNDDAVPKDFIARLRPFLYKQFSDNILSIPNVDTIQRIKSGLYIKQKNYEVSNSIGLAYVTTDYKSPASLGEVHSKLHLKHQIILIPGNGGIRTINGRNLENELDLGVPVKKYNAQELRQELMDSGYSDFDFKCLNVCPDRRWLKFFIKGCGFLWRRFFKRNKEPVLRRAVK